MKCQGNTCTVQHLVSNKLEDLHVKLLRPFEYDPEMINPGDIAEQDEDYVKVVEVLDHRFVKDGNIYDGTSSRGRARDLQLLVRYDDNEPPIFQEWGVKTKLNHAYQVHEYLRTHGLKRFIPVQYKY